MQTQTAGLGAAIVVLLFAAGAIVMVGVIFAMMWFQPGIPRSPSGCLRRSVPDSTSASSLAPHSPESASMRIHCITWGGA